MELDLVRKVWMILKWDEPLNYIDILTRIQIEEAILNYRPTIIFVEHDETFIEKLIDKIKNNEKFNIKLIVIFGYNFTYSEMQMIEKNISQLKNSGLNLNIAIDKRY